MPMRLGITVLRLPIETGFKSDEEEVLLNMGFSLRETRSKAGNSSFRIELPIFDDSSRWNNVADFLTGFSSSVASRFEILMDFELLVTICGDEGPFNIEIPPYLVQSIVDLGAGFGMSIAVKA